MSSAEFEALVSRFAGLESRIGELTRRIDDLVDSGKDLRSAGPDWKTILILMAAGGTGGAAGNLLSMLGS